MIHLKEASDKHLKCAEVLTYVTLPFSGFMTDVYLSSFPSMVRNLQVSESSIWLTMTCFLLSYGFSQLFVDGILDSYGRYKPIIFPWCCWC